MLGKIRCLTIPGVTFLRPVGPIVKIKPKRKYVKRQKTTNSGKVISVCFKLWNDSVKGMKVPTTHCLAMEHLGLQPHEVRQTGWLLDNGTYLWR